MAIARRTRRTYREQLEASQKAGNFYADMAQKPRMPSVLLEKLPPKRIYRPVDKRLVGPSEHQLQRTVITWWWHAHKGYGLPHFALFAIPNGGARDAITGSRLRDEGVRKGAPDLMLAAARGEHHGLYIEMKVHPNQPSEDQRAFLKYLNSAKYRSVVHWSADTAIEEIKAYLLP